VLSTPQKPSENRPAPSKAPNQKTTAITPTVRKERNMKFNQFFVALDVDGKFSFSKTFGPWALAVACSVTTGGQYHYAHPYASL
jgi:hypothetical protein